MKLEGGLMQSLQGDFATWETAGLCCKTAQIASAALGRRHFLVVSESMVLWLVSDELIVNTQVLSKHRICEHRLVVRKVKK